jgi:hypothetical protein
LGLSRLEEIIWEVSYDRKGAGSLDGILLRRISLYLTL